MSNYSFGIRFLFGSAQAHETFFSFPLSEEDIIFIRSFLKKNGDQPFWAFEYENEELFNRMLEAFVMAILSYVNREIISPDENPFTEETIDWECLYPDFHWPKELLE